MKTLVVGLGNPVLGDGGVGWKVAEEIQRQLPPHLHVDVAFLSLGGLALMERLIGYRRAILVDAFISDDQPGAIMILKLSDIPNYSAFHASSARDTSLQNAIDIGRSMGAQLPDQVEVVGIATKRVHDFSGELSPSVADAVPFAARIVIDLLSQVTKREEEYQPTG